MGNKPERLVTSVWHTDISSRSYTHRIIIIIIFCFWFEWAPVQATPINVKCILIIHKSNQQFWSHEYYHQGSTFLVLGRRKGKMAEETCSRRQTDNFNAKRRSCQDMGFCCFSIIYEQYRQGSFEVELKQFLVFVIVLMGLYNDVQLLIRFQKVFVEIPL